MRWCKLAGLALLGELGCNRAVDVQFVPSSDVTPAARVIEGQRIRMQDEPPATPDAAVAAGGQPDAGRAQQRVQVQPPETQFVRPDEPYGPPAPLPTAWPSVPGSARLRDGTYVSLVIDADGVLRATIRGQPTPETPEMTTAAREPAPPPPAPVPPAPPQAAAATLPPAVPEVQAPAGPVTAAPPQPAAELAEAAEEAYGAADEGEEAAGQAGQAAIIVLLPGQVAPAGQVPIYIPYLYPWPILVPGGLLSGQGPFAAPAIGASDLPGPFGFGPRPVFPVPGQPMAPIGPFSATSPFGRSP